MYSRLLLSSLFAAALFVGTANAQSGLPKPPPPRPTPTFPEVETEPLSVEATCVQADGTEADILHFAKIRFTVDRGNLKPRDNRDGFNLSRVPRDIPLTVIVRHDPTKIHNVLARILAFLRASDDAGNRSRIEVLSTDYAAVCGEPEGDEPPMPPPPHPYPPKPPKK